MYWHRCSSHTSPEFGDAVVLLGSRGSCPGLGSETMAVSSSSSASVLHASLLMDYRVHLTRTSPHHLSNKELLSRMILPKLGSQLHTPPPHPDPGFPSWTQALNTYPLVAKLPRIACLCRGRGRGGSRCCSCRGRGCGTWIVTA